MIKNKNDVETFISVIEILISVQCIAFFSTINASRTLYYKISET